MPQRQTSFVSRHALRDALLNHRLRLRQIFHCVDNDLRTCFHIQPGGVDHQVVELRVGPVDIVEALQLIGCRLVMLHDLLP